MTLMDTQFNGRVVAGRYQLGPRRGSGVDAAVFDAFDLVEQRVVAIKVVHPDLSSGEGFERAFRMAAEQGAADQASQHRRDLRLGRRHLERPQGDVCHRRAPQRREPARVPRPRPHVVAVAGADGRARGVQGARMSSIATGSCTATSVRRRWSSVTKDVCGSPMSAWRTWSARRLWTDRAHVSNALAMYAAPELAESGRRGPRGDVYSLCLTMLESMSGSVPFAGDSTVATLSNRIDRLMPVSADLGPLAAVLERAGRPLPDDRYSAAEFGRALSKAAEKLPRPAPINLPNSGLFGDASGAIARPPLPPPVPAGGASANASAGDHRIRADRRGDDCRAGSSADRRLARRRAAASPPVDRLDGATVARHCGGCRRRRILRHS